MAHDGIIIKLRGGLGNQMFQYAAGLAAATRSGRELFIDTSSYQNQSEKDTPRSFELSAFSISHVNEKRIKEFAFVRFLKRAWNKVSPTDPFAYDRRVLNKTRLDGFYQNEKYFSHIRPVILSEFTLRQESGMLKETLKFIGRKTSVGMHIRRGDYVTNPYASAHHGALDSGYFKRAFEAMSSKIGTEFTLFIFTDDIEWAAKNAKFHPDTYILSGQGFSPAEELVLLSLCSHQIISNSTFSWWAAWLNRNPNKEVMAPARWTRASGSYDILPASWTKIR